jgi:multicomponent Na+:H+ antiporter subunit A
MLFTAMLAFKQTDLKKLLAYSTLSVLGTLTMLLGIGSDLAIKAFLIYLIAHSLYKGALFLVAGSIDHETGTREIAKLGGLKKYMPVTALIALLAALSKMGIVPLIGFVGKETVYASVLEFTRLEPWLIILTIAANVFVVYITITVGMRPFFGEERKTPKHPHEVTVKMWLGPLLLGLTGIVLGIFSPIIIDDLINLTELGIIVERLNIPVKLWHGFTLELVLSVLTVLLGIIIYVKRGSILKVIDNVALINVVKPSYYYDWLLNGTLNVAKQQSKVLQNGYLRYYVMVVIISTVLLGGYVLLSSNGLSSIEIDFNPAFHEVLIALVIIAASYLAVRAKTRLASIVSLGVVGYSIALIFIMYSAPDLAMTQFAIETLTVILFVLVLYKLPKFLPYSSTSRRIRDIVIAASGGILMSLIALVTISGSLTSELKQYFAETSMPLAKGRNIVNVILVDFRALDTMGEITVLAIAAIGVYALLKLRKGEEAE